MSQHLVQRLLWYTLVEQPAVFQMLVELLRFTKTPVDLHFIMQILLKLHIRPLFMQPLHGPHILILVIQRLLRGLHHIIQVEPLHM
jgi:hypothetical protein